jgi:hypothetical protein
LRGNIKILLNSSFARGKHLNDIERLILQGTLANQTYEKISESTKYSARYLRNVALKLWDNNASGKHLHEA